MIEMVKRFIKADITTPLGAPKIEYPAGWYANAAKILVRAYDDPNRLCLAELDDEPLFQQFMASGKVIEITQAEMNTEVTRLRPPLPDVSITLRGAGKTEKTSIESLLQTKGVTYRIDEE